MRKPASQLVAIGAAVTIRCISSGIVTSTNTTADNNLEVMQRKNFSLTSLFLPRAHSSLHLTSKSTPLPCTTHTHTHARVRRPTAPRTGDGVRKRGWELSAGCVLPQQQKLSGLLRFAFGWDQPGASPDSVRLFSVAQHESQLGARSESLLIQPSSTTHHWHLGLPLFSIIFLR